MLCIFMVDIVSDCVGVCVFEELWEWMEYIFYGIGFFY